MKFILIASDGRGWTVTEAWGKYTDRWNRRPRRDLPYLSKTHDIGEPKE